MKFADVILPVPLPGLFTYELPETLAAGEEITITVQHVVTLADINSGKIENTVTAKLGDLEKTGDDTVDTEQIEITITAASDSKVYDGEELTNDGYELTKGELAEGNDIDSVKVEGSQTLVGSSDNKFTYTLNEGTLAENYEIAEPVFGTLTVKQNKTELKVASSDGEWKYDGEEHTKYEYTVTYGSESYTVSVAEGGTTAVATLENGDKVTITPAETATVKNVGDSAEKKNTFTWNVEHTAGYTKGDDEYGDLTITARSVTLTSADGEKEYDGTPLTKNAQTDVTVSGDGFVEGEATDIKATGSVTYVSDGEKTNTIVYTDGENFNADNYTITKNEGTLKITESEKALVIGSSTKSWTYDGETHTDEVYTVTYDGTALTADESGKVFTLSNGDTVTITATAEGVKDYNASYSENNTYTYEISNASSYSDVTANVGTLSINKRAVTLTSESGEKEYDGTPLTGM